jgi:hypothetical protein
MTRQELTMRISFNLHFALAYIAMAFSGAAVANAQSYSPLYAPGTSISGGYQCVDQNNQPIANAHFDVGTGVYLFTNAHLHDDPTHLSNISSVSPTSGTADSNGIFNLTLTTNKVGEAEGIDIRCSNQFGYVIARANYAVGYDDVL